MLPSNGIYNECRRKSPKVFCQCSSPEVLLCKACVGDHIVKNPGKGHETRPIEELSYYKIPGHFDRLQTRRETFPRVKEQALAGVGEVNRALSEYTAAVERGIVEFTAKVEREVAETEQRIAQLITESKSTLRNLREECEEQIAKLKKLQRDLQGEVETALEEVERTLAEDTPHLTSHYSPVLRQLTETFRSFQLFTFSIQTSPQPTITLSTQLQDSLNATELVQVTATYLRFFCCQSSTWGQKVPLRTQIQVSQSSTWVDMKDRKSLFCSGGGNY